MSSWGKKLEAKLATLSDGSSKESIQTLANWIVFNRKYAQIIANILSKTLKESIDNSKRQWLYWQLIHEILMAERGTSKWEKLIDLRVALGEGLVSAVEALRSVIPTEVDGFLKEWEDSNVFGGPSLISQMRRLYQNKSDLVTPMELETAPSENVAVKQEATTSEVEATTSEVETAASEVEATASEVEATTTEVEATTIDPTTETLPNEATVPANAKPDQIKTEEPGNRRSSFSQNNRTTDYDFDSKGVPEGKVEAKEFLEPCKAIATLQIARDVRTSTAVEISTALANMPQDILEACEELESAKISELDSAKIKDFSVRIPSNLLDLNIEEEIGSLRTFQDIVQRQRTAREKLIHLLLKSRCQFGSKTTAKEFYDTDELITKLQKRKQRLSDALELEGLDTSKVVTEIKKENPTGKDVSVEELAPLSWYQASSDEVEVVEVADSKKQRASL